MTFRETKLTTAVHEAAHAVVDVALRPYKRYDQHLSVWQTEDGWAGVCKHGGPAWHPSIAQQELDNECAELMREAAWTDCLSMLAGPFAERRWRNRQIAATVLDFVWQDVGSWSTARAGSDFEQIWLRLSWGWEGDEYRLLIDETERLVGCHWGRIVRLGRALAAAGKMTGKQASLFMP